ncbi:HD-GYP domain-containing protein [Azonexus sp. IMCC34839]|uniref:HD-GYP domain-containing protein n=1 Tax=Azonexus sp. IMCC34839 TaxID=3133695 RepID=UPI00399BB199
MIEQGLSSRMQCAGELVEQEVTLDDSSLVELPEIPSVPDVLERLRQLEAERKAAFNQMHRMVADLGSLMNSKERHHVMDGEGRLEGLYRLARVAEFRAGGTDAKILRIGVMGAMLASQLGYDEAYCDELQWALPIMDLGEIALPDRLWETPGWTGEQRSAMQAHSELGYEMLSGSSVQEMRLAAEIALNHHERFDGLGYPRRLAGTAIPMAGRIAAVVDCFDACSCPRPYRGAMSLQVAMQVLLDQRGKAFDPIVVDTFRKIEKQLFVVRWLLDDENCHPELEIYLGRAPEAGFWRRFI